MKTILTERKNNTTNLIARVIMNKPLFVTMLLSIASVCYGEDIPYMVKANFGQGVPFNNLCPDNTVAGCGPVAIAEILHYYKSPSKGRGFVSYENPKNSGQIITANLDNMLFDWSNILDEYKINKYSDTQANAVANLMFACGAAMRVAYGPSTPTQNKNRMIYCLQHNLCISPDSRYLNRQYYSTSEWLEILNSQLRDGHPVFYRGSKIFDKSEIGHMFIIDGVNDEGLYHANWGHGGTGNKYTDINILNQGDPKGIPGGDWICYNFKQAMVINCYPTPEVKNYPVQWCVLNEPIRINNDNIENEISIKQTNIFTLSTKIANCSEKALPVSCKFSLMQNGVEISSLYNRSYTNVNPYYLIPIKANMSLPKNLPDGDYEILLLTKSDAEPEWKPVYDNPVNRVKVQVDNGNANISVPPYHTGNPYLYFGTPIEIERASSGTILNCSFINPTINNFSDKIKFTITTDRGIFEHETSVCVYSQTNTKYGILIRDSQLNLSGAAITSVSASYYYANDEAYHIIGDKDISGIFNPESDQIAKDIYIYDITGIMLKKIPAIEVSTELQPFLSSLKHGIYIVVEGKKTRKIII